MRELVQVEKVLIDHDGHGRVLLSNGTELRGVLSVEGMASAGELPRTVIYIPAVTHEVVDAVHGVDA
jgi:hypothetical protein